MRLLPVAQYTAVALFTLASLTACGGGGGGSSNDTSGGDGTDSTPDAFNFTAHSEVFLSTERISESITISGINVDVPISITGGQYAIDDQAYTSEEGVIRAGQTVKVKLTSSADLNRTETAKLTISDVVAEFLLETRSTEPSGIFAGTGTVDGATTLVDVKAMIRNEHFVLFDEAERVLYDGNIVSYVGNEFTAEFDVYKNGKIVGGVGAAKVTAMGTIDPQNSIHFTLAGTGYANGSIDVTYNALFTRPATQNRFSAVSIPNLNVWRGETNTVNVGRVIGLKAPLDSDQFTGGPASDSCNYDAGIKTIPDPTINLYQLNWDVRKGIFGDPCDHEGTDFQGFATILDMPTATAGKDGAGADGIMWFAASNGEFSTFTIFTYQ